jgi:hypothetical protein
VQFVARPPGKRVSFDRCDEFADLTCNFFVGVPAGNAFVVTPDRIEIGNGFGRPYGQSFPRSHVTSSFAK